MDAPHACLPAAYDFFARQLPVIETADGLLNATIAISMHALEDHDPRQTDARLQQMAERVRRRVRSNDVEACLAHLHDVLFEEEGLAGELRHHEEPRMSYLPILLGTGRGLPIVLSVAYKAVAERIGLRVQGVNSPFHFLMRVRGRHHWLLIDPLARGQLLTRREAVNRIDDIFGRNSLRHDLYLPPATHRDWLQRILDNLRLSLWKAGCIDDFMAMSELDGLLSRAI